MVLIFNSYYMHEYVCYETFNELAQTNIVVFCLNFPNYW